MKVLILTQQEYNIKRSSIDMLNADLALVIDDDTFDIVKSRWGNNENNLPIELLQKVLLNPEGNVSFDWV